MVKSTILINDMSGAKEGTFNTAEVPDAVDIANDNELTVGAFRKLILAFHLSASTNTDTITIKAGTIMPAFRKDVGDLVYTLTGGAKELVVGPLETARYKQADGKIYVLFAGATVGGTIEAYGLR
jgi:hypothetical protein